MTPFEAIHQIESGGRVTPGIFGDYENGVPTAFGPAQVHAGALSDINRQWGTAYTTADLANNPQLGLKVGSAYYDKQLAAYGNDPVLAAAAYNVGAGNVNRMLANGQGYDSLPYKGPKYVTDFQRLTASNDAGTTFGSPTQPDANYTAPYDTGGDAGPVPAYDMGGGAGATPTDAAGTGVAGTRAAGAGTGTAVTAAPAQSGGFFGGLLSGIAGYANRIVFVILGIALVVVGVSFAALSANARKG